MHLKMHRIAMGLMVALAWGCTPDDGGGESSSSSSGGVAATSTIVEGSSQGGGSSAAQSMEVSSTSASASTGGLASSTGTTTSSVAPASSSSMPPSSSSSAVPVLDPTTTKQVYAGGDFAGQFPFTACAIAVDAVYIASQQGGGGQTVVVTGTLTQSQTNPSVFTWSSSPTDRLRIVYAGGASTEYTIRAINGNFTLPPNQFLDADHYLDFRFVNPNVVDINVTRRRTGNSTQVTETGTFTMEGLQYTVNASQSGTANAGVDSGWAYSDRSETMTGTLTTSRFNQTLQEALWSRLQIYNGVMVQNMIRTIQDQWTVDGVTYSMPGAEIRKSFKDGRADEWTYWKADGTVLRNGQPVGQLGWTKDSISVKVFLVMNGQQTVLEQYPVP